jgi:hypothetical protein
VSYDLAIWEGERPDSDPAPSEIYGDLWTGYEESDDDPSAQILASSTS